MRYAVGVDIGGTNTRVALINEGYEVIERVQFPTDQHIPMNTVEKIAETIKSFDKEIVGLGVSCPGPLDLVQQKILTTPNLPGWDNFEIAGKLTEATGMYAKLENDANLACLGESVMGSGVGKNIVQFLTISTGLGSGLVIDGEIYLGSRGFAQEVANAILWRDGPQQGNLVPGSIESISSGTAIVKRAKDAGLDVEHAGHVEDLAKAGNETAKEIMEDAKEYLANFIAILYAVSDPEIVILGGSVALKIDGFIEDVEARVKAKVWSVVSPYVKLVPTQLGEDSGIVGSAHLAFVNDDKKKA